MNLLIIPSWYPSEGKPGSGIFFREQAIALSKGGHHVTVIDVSFHGREDTINPKNFRFNYFNDEGVDTYSFKMPSFYIFSRILSIHIRIFKILLFYVFKKLLKKGMKFDIIHAHSFCPAGFCACSLSKKYHIPIIVTEHSTNIQNKKISTREKYILEDVINNSNTFICVSETLKQSIYSLIHANKDPIVIPNMFSPAFSYSAQDNRTEKSSEFIFLSTGILTERKRHAFTISCFMKAFKDISDVKLQIAGEGELYATLKQQISDNNLDGKVELLGWLNKKRLFEKLIKSSTFVLASAVETFGIVYIEAMACGLPVIAAKNGGANDIVNETNGILIEIDNEAQLVEAFKYMYYHADKYNNKQIAEDCITKYSETTVVKMLLEVYEEAKTKHQ